MMDGDQDKNKKDEQTEQWMDPNEDPADDAPARDEVEAPEWHPVEQEGDQSPAPEMKPSDAETRQENTPSQPAMKDQPAQTKTATSPEMHTEAKPLDDAQLAWFSQEEISDLRSRWKTIQGQFVDEPCSAVEQGEALVAETTERVKQWLSDQQQALSQTWLNNDDISTEELRVTLRNYRVLLDRILKD